MYIHNVLFWQGKERIRMKNITNHPIGSIAKWFIWVFSSFMQLKAEIYLLNVHILQIKIKSNLIFIDKENWIGILKLFILNLYKAK